MYGAPRSPSYIDDWEEGKSPVSLRSLCEETGEKLRSFREVSDCDLLSASARCITFIWAMKCDGSIKIAVEELAELPNGDELTGHPRRRNYPRHPADEKKLGHPCLVEGEHARIAGELFLDEADGDGFRWFANDSSGRYCKEFPPTKVQIKNAIELVESKIGDRVTWDNLEE